MKKLLYGMILLMACGIANADWVLVYTNSNGDKLYSDDASVTQSVDEPRIMQSWSLTNFKTPQSLGGVRYLSMTMYYEYDCQNMTARLLQGEAYSKRDQKGKVAFAQKEPEPDFINLVPYTSGYKLAQWTCTD